MNDQLQMGIHGARATKDDLARTGIQNTVYEEEEIKLKPWQDQFIFSTKRYPAMIAAWGTGKTMCGIMRAMWLSEEYPNNLGLIVRKEYTDLKDSTIKDFEKYTKIKVPDSKTIQLPNGSTIMFRHAAEVDTAIKQNINLGWFFIEQAEELETDIPFSMLMGRLRRKECGLRTGYVIANQNGKNWVWNNWVGKPMKDSECIQATTFDNADNLPQDYLDSLEEVRVRQPALYARCVMNEVDSQDVVDRFMTEKAVDDCNKRIMRSPRCEVIVCDPALEGDDETVIYKFGNENVVRQDIYNKKDEMETVGRMTLMEGDEPNTCLYVVELPSGEGIAARLKELGKLVLAVDVRTTATSAKYFNTRSEVWGHAGDLVYGRRTHVPNDPVLRSQLTSMRYKIRSDKSIQAESRNDFKKRMKCSPDRGTAYVLGLWALKVGRMQGLFDQLKARRSDDESVSCKKSDFKGGY